MINFWVICALLTFLACLFVLIPALRMMKKSTHEGDIKIASREKENVAIYKERLAELDLEFDDNRISQENYAQRKLELDTALLNDVNKSTVETVLPSSSKPAFTVSVLVLSICFIVGFSYWLYQENGSKPLVDQYNAQHFGAQELKKAQELARQGDTSALLKQLHEKLQSAPNNIEGWSLLAHSSMSTQNYKLASEAYLQIIRMYEEQGENSAPLYGLLAQAKYYEAEGKLTAEVDAALKKALSQDENELNSIGLLAIDAFSNQRYLEAKELWLKILSIYPEHPAKASIETGIARANAELGLQDDRVAHSDRDIANSASVVVSVTLDDSLKEQVRASDTLFIIAKQVQGSVSNPNIPLAVSKHRIDELPITVTLDDTKSMAPMAKLSMANSVVITARISKSGNPIAQSGDFEAVSSDIQLDDDEKIALNIQSKIP